MDDSRRADVVIVGGGVVGISCAFFLAAAGRRVRVVERGRLGQGASHGNCGLITPSHAAPLTMPGMPMRALRMMFDRGAPFHVTLGTALGDIGWFLRMMRSCGERTALRSARARAALLHSSRALYDELVRDHGVDCQWEARGLLEVYRDAEARRHQDELAARMEQFDVRSRAVEPDELVTLEPALRPDLAGARWFEQDAHLRPDRLVAAWAGVARGLGVEFVEEAEVRGVERAGDRIVRVVTDRGTFEGDRFVLATGAWSAHFERMLGFAIPVRPGKGYSMTMERPERCPRHPLLLKERAIAVTPWPDGYRLGGTMEFTGYREGLEEARLAAIRRGAARYLVEPEPASSDRESWFGWRPMSFDEVPFIGPAPVLRNLTLATGHGMLGVSMAPATGRLVKELIAGEPTHVDASLYRVDR